MLHVKWKFEAHFFQKFITHISLVLKEAILKEKKRTFIQTTKLWYKKTTLLLCTHYILQWDYRANHYGWKRTWANQNQKKRQRLRIKAFRFW